MGVYGGRVVYMQKYPQVSIVIPARNEEHNLPHVLPRIPHFVGEVILVDGHSTDATVEVARQVHPTIRILDQHGHGKGDALRQGFAACTGDIIVMLDADGSTDPAGVPLFVAALMRGYDFAKGSRFLFRDGWRVFQTILKEKYTPLTRTSYAMSRTPYHALSVPPK
jgi:glycosyltransferase involved in cell wall biosynthesis